VTYPDRAIANVIKETHLGDLTKAAQGISARYRAGTGTGLLSRQEALAYLATRLPATMAAARSAMGEVASTWAGFQPGTQLDLGAGPGAAAWAAAHVWPHISKVVLIDGDERMLEVGRQLAAADDEIRFSHWEWRRGDISAELPADLPGLADAADLVTACYVIGELAPATARTVVTTAWRLTKGCLVIVEPGTPAGFERIRALRNHLLSEGAHLVAPCPHDGPCPISGDDWCHFAARVNRSAIHRQLKDGELPFEDEKFSYVAFAKQPGAVRAAARVVRHPTYRRRFVELTACRGRDIAKLPFGQSHPSYRTAAKLEWGDAVPTDLLGPAAEGDPAQKRP
jgi:ribosomal protein RSM22 (predicted rRNA methylase)